MRIPRSSHDLRVFVVFFKLPRSIRPTDGPDTTAIVVTLLQTPSKTMKVLYLRCFVHDFSFYLSLRVTLVCWSSSVGAWTCVLLALRHNAVVRCSVTSSHAPDLFGP